MPQYTSDNSDLGNNYIADMAVCSDGNILFIHSNDVSIFDGESFRELEGGWEYSSPKGGACTADGSTWTCYKMSEGLNDNPSNLYAKMCKKMTKCLSQLGIL
jgi:hypothetical protein